MESNKLLEAIKNKRIEELEKELSNQYDTENEREKSIRILEQEIIVLKKELMEIKENIKDTNKEHGSNKKINDDIRQLNFLLDCVVEFLKIGITQISKFNYIETIEQIKQHKIKEKKELIESNNEIKEQVKKIVKKINNIFSFKGARSTKIGIDLVSLNSLLANRDMINKNNEYDFELIKEYRDNLEKIENNNSMISNIEENKKWIESNFNQSLELKNIQNLLKEKQKIKKILEEANNKQKEINAEINKKNKEIKTISNQIKKNKSSNINKKESLEDEIQTIQNAKTLQDLKLTVPEARSELKDNTRDYIVIPLEKGIENIFDYTKKVNIQIDSNILENTYNAETISGILNSNYTIADEETALLIPLDKIKKENIVKIEKGEKIVLKKFDLPEDSKIIDKKENNNSFKWDFDKIYYDENESNLVEKVKELLGENFTENKEEYKNYKEFDDINNNVIISDDIRKISAVLESVYSNYFKMQDRKLTVDGEHFTLEDKIYSIMRDERHKEILMDDLANRGIYADEKLKIDFNNLLGNTIKDNNTTIDNICIRIDEFINDPKNNIDNIYKDLLEIYMTENKRAKAFYNDDKYMQLEINKKKMSIKPMLPQNDDEIYKALFRKSEDKIYKVMKTAALCNKIAHLYEKRIKEKIHSENRNNTIDSKDTANEDNKELNILQRNKEILFEQKANLINTVINMSKDNDNISLGKVTDERGDGIAMDIPGYTTIVLHLPSRKSDRIERLESYNYIHGKTNSYSKEDKINGVISSGIINYGVNKQLIIELRSIKRRERLGFLNSLDLRSLQNILVSLGYTAKDFSTKEGKQKILEEISSDEGLDKILGNDELCR